MSHYYRFAKKTITKNNYNDKITQYETVNNIIQYTCILDLNRINLTRVIKAKAIELGVALYEDVITRYSRLSFVWILMKSKYSEVNRQSSTRFIRQFFTKIYY